MTDELIDDPFDHELRDGLARLSPAIDPDAAFASIERARVATRRRSFPFLTVAATVVAVLVLAGVAIATRPRDDVALDTTTVGSTAAAVGTTTPLATTTSGTPGTTAPGTTATVPDTTTPPPTA